MEQRDATDVDEIYQEYLRQTRGEGKAGHELKTWALAQYGPWTRIEAGRCFKLVADTKVKCTVFWRAPFQPACEGVLPVRTIVRVLFGSAADEYDFKAIPLNYEEAELALVPETMLRNRPTGFLKRLSRR